MSIVRKNLESHSGTDMFRDANEVASEFRGIRGEVVVFEAIVYRFPKTESKKGADIGGRTGASREGYRTAKSRTRCVVKDKTGI